MSARWHSSSSSLGSVRMLQAETVAPRLISRTAAGIPTVAPVPTMTTFFPARGIW